MQIDYEAVFGARPGHETLVGFDAQVGIEVETDATDVGDNVGVSAASSTALDGILVGASVEKSNGSRSKDFSSRPTSKALAK